MVGKLNLVDIYQEKNMWVYTNKICIVCMQKKKHKNQERWINDEFIEDAKCFKKKKERKWIEFSYRNNSISSREYKYISTRYNPWTLPLKSFLNGFKIPKISKSKAPVCFFLWKCPPCWVQKQWSITWLHASTYIYTLLNLCLHACSS